MIMLTEMSSDVPCVHHVEEPILSGESPHCHLVTMTPHHRLEAGCGGKAELMSAIPFKPNSDKSRSKTQQCSLVKAGAFVHDTAAECILHQTSKLAAGSPLMRTRRKQGQLPHLFMAAEILS